MKNALSGNGLQRELGLSSATVLVIANMVGTGIFTTSGFILAELGSPQALLLCWLFGGLFALTGALCYGELGAMMPQAGGEYIYLKRSFGPLPAFLSGWISLIVGFSAPIAAAGIACATYLLGSAGARPWYTLTLLDTRIFSISPASMLAIAAVIIFSLVHYHSLKLGQRVQNYLTTFKIAFILVLGIGGLLFGNGDSSRLTGLFSAGTFSLNGSAFAVSLIFVSFAYSGWNAAAYLGGEIRQPERNLPLALLVGTVFVSLCYLLLNLVYLYALPVSTMQGMLEVGTEAANSLFGRQAGSIIGLAIALGLLSVLSAMIMAGPRVYYAMAKDGLFFRSFGQVNSKHHTPTLAIMFQATIAGIMILSATFDALLIYIGFTLSLAAMLTIIGLIKLRITRPDIPRPYRTWGFPFTPLFFVIGNLWIVIHSILSQPAVALYGFGTIAIGWVAFRFFARQTGTDQRSLPDQL